MQSEAWNWSQVIEYHCCVSKNKSLELLFDWVLKMIYCQKQNPDAAGKGGEILSIWVKRGWIDFTLYSFSDLCNSFSFPIEVITHKEALIYDLHHWQDSRSWVFDKCLEYYSGFKWVILTVSLSFFCLFCSSLSQE